MNITQRKYACSQLFDIFSTALYALEKEQTQRNDKIKAITTLNPSEKYKQLLKGTAKLKTVSTKILRSGTFTLDDCFEFKTDTGALVALQKKFGKGQLPEYRASLKNPDVTSVYSRAYNTRAKFMYKDLTKRAKKVEASFETAITSIMLGDSVQALKAIADAKKLKF